MPPSSSSNPMDVEDENGDGLDPAINVEAGFMTAELFFAGMDKNQRPQKDWNRDVRTRASSLYPSKTKEEQKRKPSGQSVVLEDRLMAVNQVLTELLEDGDEGQVTTRKKDALRKAKEGVSELIELQTEAQQAVVRKNTGGLSRKEVEQQNLMYNHVMKQLKDTCDVTPGLKGKATNGVKVLTHIARTVQQQSHVETFGTLEILLIKRVVGDIFNRPQDHVAIEEAYGTLNEHENLDWNLCLKPALIKTLCKQHHALTAVSSVFELSYVHGQTVGSLIKIVNSRAESAQAHLPDVMPVTTVMACIAFGALSPVLKLEISSELSEKKMKDWTQEMVLRLAKRAEDSLVAKKTAQNKQDGGYNSNNNNNNNNNNKRKRNNSTSGYGKAHMTPNNGGGGGGLSVHKQREPNFGGGVRVPGVCDGWSQRGDCSFGDKCRYSHDGRRGGGDHAGGRGGRGGTGGGRGGGRGGGFGGGRNNGNGRRDGRGEKKAKDCLCLSWCTDTKQFETHPLHSFFHPQQAVDRPNQNTEALEVLRMEVVAQPAQDPVNADLADSDTPSKIWLGRRTNILIKQKRDRNLQTKRFLDHSVLNKDVLQCLEVLSETKGMEHTSFEELQNNIHELAFSSVGGGLSTPAAMLTDKKSPEVRSRYAVSPPSMGAPRGRVAERSTSRREIQSSSGQWYQNMTPKSLPSVPILVGRAKAIARLDTQSALSYIDVTWAREIGVTVDTEVKRRVQGIGRRSTESLGTTFANVTLGNCTRRLKLDVFDRKEDKCKILLGWDSMPLYGVGLHGPDGPGGGMPTAYPEALAHDEKLVDKNRAAYTTTDDFEMMGDASDRREKVYSNKVRLSEEDRLDERYVSELKRAVKKELDANLSLDPNVLCTHRNATVRLDTPVGTKPTYTSQYSIAHDVEQKVHKIVMEWLKSGKIEQSDYDYPKWNSSITAAKKKDEFGLWNAVRACLDARLLNVMLEEHKVESSKIEDIFKALNGAEVISIIDLASAYNQLPILEEHKRKTAFTWRNVRYHFRGAPFGIKHISQVLTSVMSSILFPECNGFVRAYQDDIVIFSKNREEHAGHINRVLQLLTENHLIVKPSKCRFGYNRICLLGHLVSGAGRSPDPSKLSAMWEYPRPKTKHEMTKFLSFVNFLAAYVPMLAALKKPLERYRKVYTGKGSKKKRETIVWTDTMVRCFNALKHALSSAPVLSHPDWNEPFFVATDASKYGLGAVLYQHTAEGKRKYISFASKMLKGAQIRYSATKRELLGVCFALQKFRDWIFGRKFTLFTDHEALVTWNTIKDPRKTVVNWLDVLQAFDFKVVYLPGVMNHLPDALSRLYPEWVWTGEGLDEEAEFIRVMNIQVDEVVGDVKSSIEDSEQMDSARKKEVLKADRKAVIDTHHQLGHFGVVQTVKQITKSGLYWKSMSADVTKAIAKCDACLKYSIRKRGFHPMRPVDALMPWDHIAIDLGKPQIATTSKGSNAFLVIVDVCTRYVILRAIPDMTAATVAWELWKVFADFGIPLIVQSDNGPENAAKITAALMKMVNIDHRFILPNNPRANGTAESQVKLTKNLVFKKIAEYKDSGLDVEWDTILPGVQIGLNVRINRRNGSASLELMFARPRNIFQGLKADIKDKKPMSQAQLKQRNRAMVEIVYPEVYARTKKYQNAFKQKADKTRLHALDFVEGTTVARRVMRLGKKSAPKYEGPFRISRAKNGKAFLVNPETGVQRYDRAVPFDQLKFIQGPPIESKRDDDHIYTVKTLLDTKIDLEGKVRYLTWWEAYPRGDSTWEPYSTFIDKQPVLSYWQDQGKSMVEGERLVRIEHIAAKKAQNELAKQAKDRVRKEKLAAALARKRKAPAAPRMDSQTGSRRSKRVKR
jgi:hypothetical protein